VWRTRHERRSAHPNLLDLAIGKKLTKDGDVFLALHKMTSCCCSATPVVPPPVLYVSQWSCCYSAVPCSSNVVTPGVPVLAAPNCGLVPVWTCQFLPLDPIKDAAIYNQFFPPSPFTPGQTNPPTCVPGSTTSTTHTGSRNPCGDTSSKCAPLTNTYWWSVAVPTFTIPTPGLGAVCAPCGPVLTDVNTVWVPAQKKPCLYFVPYRPIFVPGQ
jgi:hypothetical protein